MRLVTAITQALVAEVTTSFAHQYKTGAIVRFYIPPACGMQQLVQYVNTANPTYPITVTGLTTFTIPIDSSMFDPFSIPVLTDPTINTAALVVNVGELTLNLDSAEQNVLPYPAT
jgi:hypothetical protein